MGQCDVFMVVLIPVTLDCVPQSNKDGVVQYNGKMKVVVMVMEEMKQAFYNDQNQCIHARHLL